MNRNTESGTVSAAVNRDAHKLSEEFIRQKKSLGLGFAAVNTEKMAADSAAIKKAAHTLNPFNSAKGSFEGKRDKEQQIKKVLEDSMVQQIQDTLYREETKVSEERIRQELRKQPWTGDTEMVSAKVISLFLPSPVSNKTKPPALVTPNTGVISTEVTITPPIAEKRAQATKQVAAKTGPHTLKTKGKTTTKPAPLPSTLSLGTAPSPSEFSASLDTLRASEPRRNTLNSPEKQSYLKAPPSFSSNRSPLLPLWHSQSHRLARTALKITPNSEAVHAGDYLKAGSGVLAGKGLSRGLSYLSKIPVLRPVLNGLGWFAAATGVFETLKASQKFDLTYFEYTEDYDNLMNNPLLSNQDKAKIAQDAEERRLTYEKNSKPGTFTRFFKENSFEIGLLIGTVGTPKNLLNRSMDSVKKAARKVINVVTKEHSGSITPVVQLAEHSSALAKAPLGNPALNQIPQTKPETALAGVISQTKKVSPPNPRLTNKSQVAGPSHNANNINAKTALNTKMRALQKAQNEAVRIQEFNDGRVRYYMPETPSRIPGQTRGSTYVTEYNRKTGQVRAWRECYDHQGNINRIHPKMINGCQISGQHYPPTASELNSFTNKPEGPK